MCDDASEQTGPFLSGKWAWEAQKEINNQAT